MNSGTIMSETILSRNNSVITSRGGVEDTTFEAKAKDSKKKIRGQGQGSTFRGQTLSRSRIGMVEAKDRGHNLSMVAKFSINFKREVLKILHFVKF